MGGTEEAVELTGLALQHGVYYRAVVVAINGAGQQSTIATKSVYVDTSAPEVGVNQSYVQDSLF